MVNEKGVVNGLYNASASVGSVTSIIYLVIGIIVGVICLISAIYNFITEPQTSDIIVNGETKTKTSSSDPIIMGIVSLIAAILIAGLSYGNYYLTERYKGYAALEGASAAIGVVKNI